LAKTDIRVSAVCFGCWGIIGGFNWGPQEEQDSIAALHTAFDAGINFYDTAEGYGSGQSEQLLARGLGHVRDQIVIATKVSPNHFAPAEMRAACEGSLRALNTDHIDLYQLHWPNHDLPISETLECLEALKAEGKIRAYGVSNFGPRDLSDARAAQSEYAISSNQVAYSLLFRAIEYGILPLCQREDIAVLTYSSLMQGLLAGRFRSADDVQPDRARTRHYDSTSGKRPYARHGEAGAEAETFDAIEAVRQIAADISLPMSDVALAWLMAQPGVTAVIAGARNAEQARGIARAAEVKLDAQTMQRLNAATDALKAKLGENPDMWQGVSRMR
jgi:aryl-alcohol dehydrogenase-like predicted oxidoreductase